MPVLMKGASMFSGLGSGKDPNVKPKLGGDSSVEAVTEVLKDILIDTSVLHDVLKAGEVPESEKKEIALDAEVRHRELLEAIMSSKLPKVDPPKKKRGEKKTLWDKSEEMDELDSLITRLGQNI